MPEYLTVVYTINDKGSFTNEREKLMEKFKASKGEPWAVTAMSRDHEMTRLSFIEEALESRDTDLIEDICGCPGIGKFNSLEEFKNR